MRLFKPNLEKMLATHDVKGLIKTLNDPEKQLRFAARDALIQIGVQALPELCAAVHDPRVKVRNLATWAISVIVENSPGNAQAQAVQVLLSVLQDEDSNVRANALVGLSRVLDPQSFDKLVQHALNDLDSSVRLVCVKALSKIDNARVIETLCKTLGDNDINVSTESRKALVRLGSASVDKLIPSLKEPNLRVRSQAVWALGDIRDGRAVRAVINVLNDENNVIVKNAIVTLGKLRDFHAMPYLLHFLEKHSKRFEGSGDRFIGEILHETIFTIKNILSAFINDGAVEEFRSPDVKDVRAVIGLLNHSDLGNYYIKDQYALEELAKKALVKLGKEAVEPLCEDLKNGHWSSKCSAADLLKEIKDPMAIESLIEVIESQGSSEDARFWLPHVTEALSEFTDKRAIDFILRRTFFLDEHVVDRLAKQPDVDIVDLLLAMFSGKNEEDRQFAAKMLIQHGDDRVVEPLWHCLSKTKTWGLQEEIIYVLARMGDTRVAEMTIDALFERNPDRSLSRSNLETYANLFRDYTAMILGAAYGLSFNVSVVNPYDTTEKDKAVAKICDLQTPLTSNLLYKIIGLQDMHLRLYDHNNEQYYYEAVDFAGLREKTRNELAKRGNPPYNPLIYLDEKNWIILKTI